jgi:hypothetical protein
MIPSGQNRNFQSFAGFLRRGLARNRTASFMAVRADFKGQDASAAVPGSS